MDTNHNPNHTRRGRRPHWQDREDGAGRPYRFALFPNPEGGYVLRSPDLPGRTAEVASIDEVGAALRIAVEAPNPGGRSDEEGDGRYSGKFVLRLPRTLHRQLAELAVEEGVSLNQLALTFLAEGMGRVDAAQDFGNRRGGGRRGHGPGRRGSRDEQMPERRGPSRVDLRSFGQGGNDQPRDPADRSGDRQGNGRGRGHGPRHQGRPNFAAPFPGQFPGFGARPEARMAPDADAPSEPDGQHYV